MKLFLILTSAAVLIILPGMIFCISYIHKLKNVIVDEAIITLPLNLDIMSQGSKANLHDSLVSSMLDLQIAKVFHERMLKEQGSISAAYLNASDTLKYHWEVNPSAHNHSAAVLWTDQTKTSEEMLTPSQLNDANLCRAFNFFQTNLLNFQYRDLTKQGSYIGFDSHAFCYSPQMHKDYFDHPDPEFACSGSSSSYYSHVCRDWYKF